MHCWRCWWTYFDWEVEFNPRDTWQNYVWWTQRHSYEFSILFLKTRIGIDTLFQTKFLRNIKTKTFNSVSLNFRFIWTFVKNIRIWVRTLTFCLHGHRTVSNWRITVIKSLDAKITPAGIRRSIRFGWFWSCSHLSQRKINGLFNHSKTW